MLGRLKSLFSLHNLDPAHYRASMSSGKPQYTHQFRKDLSHEPPTTASTASQPEIATFAAGCFWGVEHIFLKHFPPSENKGILSTAVGYTGGNPLVKNPNYEQVCGGATDHAEALKIEFDPSIVTYAELVGKMLDCVLKGVTC